MTDNIIIQSLTICSFYENSCNKCPLCKTDICNNISKNAFDLIKRQKEEIEKLHKFKSYFDDLYEKGLEVTNWHLNGNTEPFDNFYESALKEMEDENG